MPDTKDVQLPGKIGLKAIGGCNETSGCFNSNWFFDC